MADIDPLELTLRNSRRAAAFAFFCVLFVGLMLVIDGQRNKIMLAQVQEARRILDEFYVAVQKAVGDERAADVSNAEPAEPAGVGGSAGDGVHAGSNGRPGAGDDAGAGAADVADEPAAGEGGSVPWPVRESAPGGVRGNEF